MDLTGPGGRLRLYPIPKCPEVGLGHRNHFHRDGESIESGPSIHYGMRAVPEDRQSELISWLPRQVAAEDLLLSVGQKVWQALLRSTNSLMSRHSSERRQSGLPNYALPMRRRRGFRPTSETNRREYPLQTWLR